MTAAVVGARAPDEIRDDVAWLTTEVPARLSDELAAIR